ncbi:MAG: glycosyltransferase family 39 protein [Anaerolineales bacterium]|nr:glycosyltransferase family 39 protein [Anaerolineales bacterium]
MKMKISFPARIFLVAFVLRLVPVLLSFNLGIGLDDMFQYDMLARSLVAGNGYRWYAQEDLPLIQPYINLDLSSVDYDPRGVLTSFRPPLYPAFLALIYFLAGVDANRFFTARLVQAFLGAALVPLTYALARRFFPENEKAAKISAWVVACYPLLVIYPLSLATENLFFVLALSAMLALRARWFILAGILLGLTALTRSVSLVFAGLSVLWIWFGLRERKMAVLVFLTVTVVTLPWMVRNTLLHGRLTGIESALGYDLYMGYHPEGFGTFQYPQSLELMTMMDDGLRDEIGQAKAIEFIKADPGRIPYLAVRRLGYFFGLERRALTYFYSNNFFGYISTPLLLTIAAIVLMPFMIVSASAAFGLAITRWRRENLLMALFILGYLTPHIFILGEDRFHLTLIPFLGILAAQFWSGGLAAFKVRVQTRSGRIALLFAGLAVLLLFLNWGLELQRDAGILAQLLGPNGNQTYFPY